MTNYLGHKGWPLALRGSHLWGVIYYPQLITGPREARLQLRISFLDGEYHCNKPCTQESLSQALLLEAKIMILAALTELGLFAFTSSCPLPLDSPLAKIPQPDPIQTSIQSVT